MEIFNQEFVNAVIAELNALPFDGSITREKLCVKLGVDPVNMPVISLLLLRPEFGAFESAKKAGIRRVKVPASPVVSVSEPVMTPDPEPVTEAVSEPASEPDEATVTKPILNLVGTDGNAFALMGKASRVAKANGMDWNTILGELTSGDYDNLLATLFKYFDVR